MKWPTRFAALFLSFVVGLGANNVANSIRSSRVKSHSTGPTTVSNKTPPLLSSEPEETYDQKRPADYFLDQDELLYLGYTIKRRSRKAWLNYPEEAQTKAERLDIAYVAITNGRKLLKNLDADVYSGYGNSANAGLFPFLDRATPQLFISQDVPRGGCQWVVSLSPKFRVIFDGQEFAVGREAFDLRAMDLNHDGVYEIVLPITDFYELQDKMNISEIPLPDVVFKYDLAKAKYLPANPLFRDYLVDGTTDFNGAPRGDELSYRSYVLHRILPLIYAGERDQAWSYFRKTYKLADKEELERRVRSILNTQPVYNFIYHRKPKR